MKFHVSKRKVIHKRKDRAPLIRAHFEIRGEVGMGKKGAKRLAAKLNEMLPAIVKELR